MVVALSAAAQGRLLDQTTAMSQLLWGCCFMACNLRHHTTARSALHPLVSSLCGDPRSPIGLKQWLRWNSASLGHLKTCLKLLNAFPPPKIKCVFPEVPFRFHLTNLIVIHLSALVSVLSEGTENRCDKCLNKRFNLASVVLKKCYKTKEHNHVLLRFNW